MSFKKYWIILGIFVIVLASVIAFRIMKNNNSNNGGGQQSVAANNNTNTEESQNDSETTAEETTAEETTAEETTAEETTTPETTTAVAEAVTDSEPETTAVVEFKTYSNSRFGYNVEYPADFIITAYPDNGDGAWFENGKGDKLTISGINNVLDDTVDTLTETLKEGCTVTEKLDDFYSYTETVGEDIQFNGVKVGADVIVSYCLTVKADRAEEYADIVKHMNEKLQ